MKLLVDMDGVLADFTQGVLSGFWKLGYHNEVDVANQNKHTLTHRGVEFGLYPYFADVLTQQEFIEIVDKMIRTPGFTLGLDTLPQAIDSIHHLLAEGIDIQICSSPVKNSDHSEIEKRQWLSKHLGPDIATNACITRNKHTVPGDFLLDDAIVAKGEGPKTWQQIWYGQPWVKLAVANNEIDGDMVIEWEDNGVERLLEIMKR